MLQKVLHRDPSFYGEDADMSAPQLNPHSIIEIGETLEIEDKQTGFKVKWKFNSEQMKAAFRSCASMAAGTWGIHAKSRQVGMSTYFCLEDVLWTITMARNGMRARTAIILDTDLKAAARLDQCEDFLKQLKYPHRRFAASNRGPERIEILDGSGSEIHAYGTFGSRIGSSLTYNRFHLSELPYWNSPSATLASLLPTLSGDGYAVLETTMDVTDPTPKLLWGNTKNRWEKIFYSVEDHDGWTRDPALITDAQWEWAQEEGFTRRDAASWWFNNLEDNCAGDMMEAFHLYPQIPSHLFRLNVGRFVKVDPKVFPPLRVVAVEGVSDSWEVEIYQEPDEDDSYALSIDTAEGKGLDRTVVLALSRKTGRLAAAFVSPDIWYDDTATVALALFKMYTVGKPYVVHPIVLVENNGPGDGTVKACRRLGLPVKDFATTEGRRHTFLVLAKRAVEKGHLEGSAELAKDCEELYLDHKGRWVGRKDFLMAAGFALQWCLSAPHTAREERQGPGLLKSRIMRHQKAQRRVIG